jgi:hypothetical protein
LDYIHALTNDGRRYEVRFDMTDFDGSHAYAVYDTFSVDAANTNYTLHVTGYNGTAGMWHL